MLNFRMFVLALILVAPGTALSAGAPKLTIDTNLYPYLDRIDSDTDLTVAINARFPARFSYFGYMNYHGAFSDVDFGFRRSEQNLRWSVSKRAPIDLNLQAVLVDGDGNDFTQLGVGWRVHDTPRLRAFFDRLNLVYRVTVQFRRFGSDDDKVWQMEHFFKWRYPAAAETIYLSGFVDQSFDLRLAEEVPEQPVVAEIQAGVRLWKDFFAIAEYRVNQFRLGNEYNLAVGIEYKYRWP